MRIGSVVIVVWLLIGFVAATQRGYLHHSNLNCSQTGDVVLTVVAGPLNYAGLNPKVKCTVPKPSK